MHKKTRVNGKQSRIAQAQSQTTIQRENQRCKEPEKDTACAASGRNEDIVAIFKTKRII